MDTRTEAPADGWLAADYMITASGLRFCPTAPDVTLVRIDDIAQALSMICRYNGHVTRFYSVAEHSVLLARHFMYLARDDLARQALLHDASEAYLGDVIRPLKRSLPQYITIEQRVERAICLAFRLDDEMPPEVKAADSAILHDERMALFPEHIVVENKWHLRVGLGVQIDGWPADKARREFLTTYDLLFTRGLT